MYSEFNEHRKFCRVLATKCLLHGHSYCYTLRALMVYRAILYADYDVCVLVVRGVSYCQCFIGEM